MKPSFISTPLLSRPYDPRLTRRPAHVTYHQLVLMIYGLLADAVVVVHFGFVVFVVLGGLLVLRWPKVAWVHLPAVAWGAVIEFAGWICPLTPLENWFRAKSGNAVYATGFIEHYILPVLYPAGLTRGTQIVLGLLVLAVNVAVYGWLIWRRAQRIHYHG